MKIMKDLLNKFLGRNEEVRQSEFSRFVYDSSNTQKKKLIEKVIKEANRDQSELTERAKKMRMAN